jgi:IS5 family transposase
VQRHLAAKGLKVATGTIVDATIINAPSSTKNADKARDLTNRRYRHRGIVDEVERRKNRTKSKVRARVEHAIGIIKRVFGFAKVRYRGLRKNTHRLLVTCALANLFMARR